MGIWFNIFDLRYVLKSRPLCEHSWASKTFNTHDVLGVFFLCSALCRLWGHIPDWISPLLGKWVNMFTSCIDRISYLNFTFHFCIFFSLFSHQEQGKTDLCKLWGVLFKAYTEQKRVSSRQVNESHASPFTTPWSSDWFFHSQQMNRSISKAEINNW